MFAKKYFFYKNAPPPAVEIFEAFQIKKESLVIKSEGFLSLLEGEIVERGGMV